MFQDFLCVCFSVFVSVFLDPVVNTNTLSVFTLSVNKHDTNIMKINKSMTANEP